MYCTIVGNGSAGDPAPIYTNVDSGRFVHIIGSIIYGHSGTWSVQAVGAGTTQLFSCINSPGTLGVPIFGGCCFCLTDPCTENPLFIDADGPDDTAGTLDDNPRLAIGSPAIDPLCVCAGNPGIPQGIPFSMDLDGNARAIDAPFVGSDVYLSDLGCYEFVPNCTACPGDRYWTNAAGGAFEFPLNWQPYSAPDCNRAAVFNLDATYEVSFSFDACSSLLQIARGAVTFDLNGHYYQLTDTSPLGALRFDNPPVSSTSLTLTGGGELAVPYGGVVRIGSDVEDSASLRVTGTGTDFFAGSDLCIGCVGEGSMFVTGGASATSFIASIGEQPGATGDVLVSGAGSLWDVPFFMNIGSGNTDGSGALTVESGGIVAVGPGGILVLQNGMLLGDGTIIGDVTTIGDVHPGPDQGLLTIMGDYEQVGQIPGFGDESGTLFLEIGGTPAAPTSDRLHVMGVATLGGGLILQRDPTLMGAITLPQGQTTLDLVTADIGVLGFFDVAFLPAVGEQGKFFRAGTASPARAVGTSVVLTIEGLAAAINTSANDVDNLGATPAAAVLGDFNGENGIDLAVALPDSANPTGAAGDLIILYNSGSTGSTWDGWSMGAVQDPVGVNPSGIAAAELDGSPGLDLVISNEGDNNVTVLCNDGTIGAGQSFTAAGVFSVGDAPSAVVARDLDLDGFADVAVSNSGADSVSLLQNRGIIGTWQGLGQTLGSNRVDLALPAGAAPRDLCASRLNAGNDLEIAVANTGTDSISVISNDPTLRAPWGGGRFQIRPPEPTGPRPVTIEPIANPDEDKWDALGTVNFDGGSISLILNNTDGASIAFRPHVEVPIGADPASLVGVDLDNDGDEDLAVVARDDGGTLVVRVLRNDTLLGDAGATYSRDADITSTSNPLLVLAGNVNSTVDSTVDLVVLSDATLLAGARGMQPAESQVVLNVPPAPPPVCLGDADRNDTVNFTDILSVLANFGGGGPAGDADHNNIVNFNDVLSVLANFGAPCP